MLSKKQIELLEQAVEKYGKEPQVLQSIEEMSELSKELLKNVNRNKENISEIILEIADVIIMIIQLNIIYTREDKSFNEKLQGAIEYKIQKLKKYMEEK